GSTVTLTGAGTVVLAANQLGNYNYSAAPEVTTSFTMAVASQTISPFRTIPAKTFGSSPFTVAPPAASSGLPVVLSVKSGPATISGRTVTLTGTGTVVLAANQLGNSNCTAAPEVTTSFTVGVMISVAITGNNTTGNGSLAAPFATIQKAVDTASNGDVVIVSSGTYSGTGNWDINLRGKTIIVKSSAGPSQTILDLGRNKGFSATSTETNSTEIQGFTIINGYVTSDQDWVGTGIIDITGNAGLTIEDCIFHDNEEAVTYLTTNAQIIAKFGNGAGKVTVRNCLFYNNKMYGGEWMGWSFSRIISLECEAEVDGCTIANNQLTVDSNAGGHPIMLGYSGVAASIRNTIVWGNTAATNGMGIEAISVSYCIFDTIADSADGSHTAFQGIPNINPLFVSPSTGNFGIATGSPAINAGDPGSSLDPDGSRADIGFNLAKAITTPTPTPTYTVTPSAGANGGISPNTQQTVASGSSAVFTATPTSGFVVDQWLVNGGVVQAGSASYTLANVTANQAVQVTFKPAPVPTYTVTPSAGANGGISPNTPQTVVSGSSAGF
ncbi:MAG: hypothetical protein WCH84_11675, partial [Verrucomicrobiota bacterium]